ncbi:MAG: hypothetical protein ABSF57_09825 [Acidobacteriaceae bacterium]
MAIHSYPEGRITDSIELGAPAAHIVIHSHATRAAGSAVESSATVPTTARGSLRPSVPLIRKPAKGSSGMNQR